MSNHKSPSDSPLSITIPVRLPPGYRVVGSRIEVDPVQAKRIVALFRDYAARSR
jgi:hypothetical protein